MLLPHVRSLVPVMSPTLNIDRLLEQLLRESPLGEFNGGTFPAWNVSEDERSFCVEAELPGFTHENLEIQVRGNELRLSGSRENTEDEKTTVHLRERFTGEFSRVLRLTVPVDADQVQAVFKDGILTVTLPKSESALPRKIQVQAAAA